MLTASIQPSAGSLCSRSRATVHSTYLYRDQWASMMQVVLALGNMPAKEGHVGREVEVPNRIPYPEIGVDCA